MNLDFLDAISRVNGWTDFANYFFVVFVIFSRRLLCNNNLRNLTGKVGNIDEKTTIVAPSVQQENKLNNNIFLFIVRSLLVMIEYNYKQK